MASFYVHSGDLETRVHAWKASAQMGHLPGPLNLKFLTHSLFLQYISFSLSPGFSLGGSIIHLWDLTPALGSCAHHGPRQKTGK